MFTLIVHPAENSLRCQIDNSCTICELSPVAKNVLVSLGTVIFYLYDLVVMIVYVTIYTDSNQNIF